MTEQGVGKKIIIVDDDKSTREMLQTALELEGFEVRQAVNGLRLVSALRVEQPDLILLDIMMSWIDGFELCRSIKRNEEFRRIPLIFISAKKGEDDVRHGFEVGCVDYFTKPIDLEKLLGRIRDVLAHEAHA